jgi:hypothetical protein
VTILKGIRAYHALLALSVVAAFLTGEAFFATPFLTGDVFLTGA